MMGQIAHHGPTRPPRAQGRDFKKFTTEVFEITSPSRPGARRFSVGRNRTHGQNLHGDLHGWGGRSVRLPSALGWITKLYQTTWGILPKSEKFPKLLGPEWNDKHLAEQRTHGRTLVKSSPSKFLLCRAAHARTDPCFTHNCRKVLSSFPLPTNSNIGILY